MVQNRIWLWLSIALLLFFVLGLMLSSDHPQVFPDYVSESPSPTGVKGFYTYLKDERKDVSRWQGSPERLPAANDKQMLMMVEPYRSLSQNEMIAYQEWMEAGNTIWILIENPVGFFNVQVDWIVAEETNRVSKIKNTSGEEYDATVPDEIRLLTRSSDDILLSDSMGALALRRPFGAGELIVSLQPDWMTNGSILDKDHLPILLYLLQQSNPQEIFVDEYVHGQKNIPTALTLYPKWFLLLCLQVLLLALLWLWMKGKRFGAIYVPREEVVRFGDERISALAAWYIRGDFYKESLTIQEEYLRHILYEKWGVPTKANWEDIKKVVQKRLPQEQQKQWDKWTQELAQLAQKKSWTKKEYLSWSKKLDEIRKEVEE